MNIKIPTGVNLPDYPPSGHVASVDYEAMRLKMLMYREMYRSLLAGIDEILVDLRTDDIVDDDPLERITTLNDARVAEGHLSIERLTPIEQALIEANADVLVDFA